MKPTVYIETTIPSYYCDNRPAMAADIARTREWWDQERVDYECFISLVVLEELEHGEYPNQEACLDLVKDLPLLDVTREIDDIAEVYMTHKLMHNRPFETPYMWRLPLFIEWITC